MGVVTFPGSTGSCILSMFSAATAQFSQSPTVVQQFFVARGVTVLTITPAPPSVVSFGAGSFIVSLTTTPSSDGSLSLVVAPPSADVCSLSFGGSNTWAVSSNNIGQCVLLGSAAQGTNFNASAVVTYSFNVTRAPQTIVFGSLPSSPIVNTQYVQSVSSSGTNSGNNITLSADPSTASVCSVGAGFSVSLLQSGLCILNAVQPGNLFYLDANASTSFFVLLNNSISFTSPIPTAIFNGPVYNPAGAVVF